MCRYHVCNQTESKAQHGCSCSVDVRTPLLNPPAYGGRKSPSVQSTSSIHTLSVRGADNPASRYHPLRFCLWTRGRVILYKNRKALLSEPDSSLPPNSNNHRLSSLPTTPGYSLLAITLHYGQQCARPLPLMPEGWYCLSAAHVHRVQFAGLVPVKGPVLSQCPQGTARPGHQAHDAGSV